jgi:tetratricopeptide (TPR) repeat protein
MAALAPAAIVLLALAALAWRQVRFWRSDYDLWSHTLAATQYNPIAEHNISIDLMARGKLEEARFHLQRAVAIDPGDTVSRVNLAVALQDQGHYSESLQQYAVVLQQASDPRLLPIVYENIGNIYYVLGDFSKAEESYMEALRVSPGRTTAIAKLNKLRADKQINAFANLVADHPTADGYLRLGRMLSQADWIPQARYSYQKALEIDPSLQEARNALAALPPESSMR